MKNKKNETSRKMRFTNEVCDVELVTMTKTLVDSLIAGNEGNRKINKANIAKITDDVLRGEFVFTGQPIIRDDNGKLLDGQHRLLAFRACGYPPVTCLLVTRHGDGDSTTSAYLHMDTGVSRQFKVFLAHSGISDPHQVGSLCKKLSYIASDYGSFASKTDTYMKKVYQMYRREIELIAPLVKRIKGFNADMGAAACAIARVTGCGEEIAALVNRAARGDMLRIGSPAHTLSKIIMQGRSIDCRGTGHNQFSFAVVAHAIIAELNKDQYPVMNRNVKKSIAWIREMAESNDMFVLPSEVLPKKEEETSKSAGDQDNKNGGVE